MSYIDTDIKQSKILEFNDLLGQVDKAQAKKDLDITISDYEQQLLNSEYDKWRIIVAMLSSGEIEDTLWEDFLENPTHYTITDNEILYNENWEAEEEQKEKERIAKLYMTGTDVERAILQVKGMDFDDIKEMCKDESYYKALKVELNANNFYRGNPYIDKIGALLGFTSEQLDNFFETKDPQALVNS